MPRFSIAFITPTEKALLKHKVVEAPDQDGALKSFFSSESSAYYSNDEQGYFYFREDFFDEAIESGSILKID